MTTYLFPVRSRDSVELLPHVAADMPTEFAVEDPTIENGLNVLPEHVQEALERLYPEKDIETAFSNPIDLYDALDPARGILVQEFHSQPHTVVGYHESLSEDEGQTLISEIEERLGYELEGKQDIEPLPEEEIINRCPKTAGWTRDGKFRA